MRRHSTTPVWLPGAFALAAAVFLAPAQVAAQDSSQGGMPMASSGSDPRLERRMSQMGVSHDTGPELSLYVGVPIANDVDRDVVRPGGSIDFRAGWDLGYFVPELETGFMGLPVRANRLDPALNNEPLKHFYFGAGMRLQIPTNTIAVPYLSGAFNFQFWNLIETQTVCDPWYCWEERDYSFTPGFTGRAGVELEASKRVSVDIGLRAGMAFGVDVFPSPKSWLTPSLGITWRR